MMVQERSTEPKRPVAEAAWSIVLTVCLPISALRISMGFRYNMRRHCGTYVNMATLATPSTSMVVLPVQQWYCQYILDQGPALPNVSSCTYIIQYQYTST